MKLRYHTIILLILPLVRICAEEPGVLEKAKEAITTTTAKIEEGTKEIVTAAKGKAVELGHATQNSASKAYDNTIVATKHAAEVAKDKAVEAGGVVKGKSGQAYMVMKEVTHRAAKKTVEVSKETAQAATEKTLDLLTTQKELELYDTNHDGRLDAAERAKMKAAAAAVKTQK